MKFLLKLLSLFLTMILSFFISGYSFILLISLDEVYFQKYYLLSVVLRTILNGYLVVSAMVFVLGITAIIYIFDFINNIKFDKY